LGELIAWIGNPIRVLKMVTGIALIAIALYGVFSGNFAQSDLGKGIDTVAKVVTA
jgi:hypothetical protein